MSLFCLEDNSHFTVPSSVHRAPESLVNNLRHILGAAILFYRFLDGFSVDFIIQINRGFDQ